MGQLGFYINMMQCTGCKACEIACKDKNDLEVGTLFRKVDSFDGGKFPKVWSYSLSLACNHCENAKCTEDCPTDAIYKRKDDGLVIIDKDKCIGCKKCIKLCPYDHPQYIEEEKKCGKCDGCLDLVERGENPACVDACPMRALEFGDIENLRKKYGSFADLKVLPNAEITKPSITINAKDEAKLSKQTI